MRHNKTVYTQESIQDSNNKKNLVKRTGLKDEEVLITLQ